MDESTQAQGMTIFAAGDEVGRYRIVRFLARGGAAEVYVAEDLELGDRVALKAIRREYSGNPEAIERFKREISLARQVTHPNVCRIYEFGNERRGSEDVLFLTMELLEGETLHDRIRSQGPMPPEEALPLLRQMAAGLEAAQKVGVVHRDFKSGNVMLVRAEGEEGGVRAVVADFGMARAANEGKGGLVVTRDDMIVGSPAYMAPEQVESGPISAATDIYSVGVVLFEMVTGRFPFQAETALATALMRLEEKPPSPKSFARGLDDRWEKAILRCLERDPAKRFASAGEVVAALAGEAPVRPPPRRRRALALVAAAVLAASAGLLLLSRSPLPPESGETAASFAARPSIALLGFRNLSGRDDAAWLSTALAEMLATEVAAGEHLRVIPGESVARTRIELGLAESDGLAADTLARVGEILGSDLVVEGSYLLAGAENGREIRLDLQVRQADSGETVARASERGTEAEILNLVEQAGRALRDSLGVGAVSEADAAAVRASRLAGPESARPYAEGLEKLRRYDARAALELLEAAREKDPENPLIHSAMSEAWKKLGYAPRARAAAERAFELAGDLSRRDRLWVEARYREISRDRQEAASIYGVLWDFFPDSLAYGLQLADAQVALGQAEVALETVEKLRSFPAVAGDPRIDLAEARAARALSQYQRQQERSARAAEKAEALGARFQVARSRELEAGAWRDLGEPDKAMAAFEEAKAIYESANNRGPVARILIAVGQIHRYQARFEEARALCEQALEVAQEIGDQGSSERALSTLANILRQQGHLEEALTMQELVLETSREIGEARSIQIALTSVGVAQRLVGDLEGAKERFTEALAAAREAGNKRGIAINLNMLGEVALHQGRPGAARRHYLEALENNRDTRSPRGRAYYLSGVAKADMAAGDLAAAREGHEEALAIRLDLGEKTNVARSLLSLGLLAFEEGRLDDAGLRAHEAAAEYESGEQADAQSEALALLARIRLAQGRPAEAQAAADRASALVAATENQVSRLGVGIWTAEVAAATGDVAGARRALEKIVEEATDYGFVDFRLEGSLTLGRIEQSAGETSAAAARLDAVAREAEERGLGLLARKAAAEG